MVTKTNLYKVTIIMRNRNLFHYRQGQSAKCRVHCYGGLHGYRHKDGQTDRQRERADEGRERRLELVLSG